MKPIATRKQIILSALYALAFTLSTLLIGGKSPSADTLPIYLLSFAGCWIVALVLFRERMEPVSEAERRGALLGLKIALAIVALSAVGLAAMLWHYSGGKQPGL